MSTLKTLLSIAFAGALIDFVGFYYIVGPFFKRELLPLLRLSGDSVAPIWLPAILVYVTMAFLVVFFVLPKAGSTALSALLWGALMGLLVYGVYEFTNYALLKDWKLSVLVVDMLWGTFFGAVLSYIGFHIARFFN